MKKTLLAVAFSISSFIGFAQCPEILASMINACGTSEGNNEFVVFTTAEALPASSYKFYYGQTIPPTQSSLAGTDAGAKIGVGSISATNTPVIEITDTITIIPANSRVIFVSTAIDNNYNVNGLYDGVNPVYVVYIKTNVNGGINSNWSNTGNLSNSATATRYLQIAIPGSTTGCDKNTAECKSYIASGNWPILSGVGGDGNFITWNGATAIYTNSGCNSIVAPVTLTQFNANNTKDGNVISWQTSQEINSNMFVVEKSFDSKQFSAIANVSAAGNSNIARNYRFTDKNVAFKTTYYRLKSVDIDGSFSYSAIAKVSPSKNNLSIANVYPVPANKTIHLEWNNKTMGASTVMLMDINGRTIATKSLQNIVGLNRTSFDLNGLPSGQYVLKIITANEVVNTMFTK